MTKQAKETIAVCVSKDVLDYISEGVASRKFADASHAFELMAFEHMSNIEPKDESTLEKLERMTMGTVNRTVDAVKETAGTFEEKTMKVYNESTEKIAESSFGKTVKESVDKVEDRTKSAFEYSRDLVKESVDKVKDTIVPGEQKECGCGEKDCDCAEKGKKIDIE